MTESDPNSAGDPSPGPKRLTPRWVTVVGILVAAVLVLLFVVLHVTGVLGPGAH